MLVPLPSRSSSARETYLTLRDAILSGGLPPDSRLYEHRLGAELGVSRTPVREALAMLEAEELVVSVPNRGTIVRRITPDEVRETYDVRAVLEGYAARRAAGRIGGAELARLRRLARDMRRALARVHPDEDRRVQELASLNAHFHKTLAAAAGNRVLQRTIESLIDTPLYARAYFWYRDELKRASFDDHERMLDLLASGDADQCERFWRGHLKRGRDELIRYLREEEADGA